MALASGDRSFLVPAVLPALLLVASGLVGCQSSSETFVGKPANQVWTAMVKAAEQPAYSDWHVIENDVWTDDTSGRIEVWRLLRRYRDPAGQWPRLEDQEWKLSIRFHPTEPPTAEFDVRSMCVPSHSWMESERYFDQVWALLGGRPAAPAEPTGEAAPAPTPQPTAAPAPAPAPAPAEPAAPPEVDVPT